MDDERIPVRRAPVENRPTHVGDRLREAAFRPPEQVAEEDAQKPTDELTNDDTSEPTPPPKKKRRSLKAWLKSRTKKQWILIIVIIIVVLGGASAGAYALFHKSAKTPTAAVKTKSVPMIKTPTTVPSTLTGLPVPPSANQGPVTAVMIENTDDARPQSGLSQAGVVFEALTEGGITRFMALYQGENPSSIGPIRSARPYYLQWALGFDAAVAHDGGSSDALQDFTSWNVKDLNEMYNGSYYQRIDSREAPHNLYSSMSQLNALEQTKGWTTSKYTGFVRKTASPSKTPNATSITLNPSYADFSVQYKYDATNNAYLRSEDGSPMMDAGTNTQVEPKVVIAMVVPWSQGALDTSGAYYSVYADIGSGQVYIFQDGTVTTGTWTKSSMTGQITFTNASGQTIGLDPGQTWITALGDSSMLSYQ